MQTLTWSPNLRNAVKEIKINGIINAQSTFTETNIITTSTVSTLEKDLIKKSFTKNSTDQVQGTWF